ncbi:sensor domain-containing diguanylate cyclase [Halospina denitrificans]|nr:diguanylate cyclase [Halospina denitrificans]
MGGHRLLPGLFVLVVLVLVLVALVTLRDGAARATPPAEPTLLPESVELLQTADPSTDPADVASSDQWQRRTLPLNLGLTGDTVWLRVAFEGPNEASGQPWVLHLDNASLNRADLWLYEEDEAPARVHYRTGQRYPFSERPIEDSAFAFPLALKPETAYRAYLRVETHAHMRIPLTLMPMDAYINERLTHRIIQGAYFGLMLVIALASLVIFFSIRDRAYLYYFGFILTTGLWFFIRQGFAEQYLWPDWPWWSDRAYIVMMAAGAGMSVLFTREFLSLRTCHPPLFRIMTVLLWVWGIMALYALFVPSITTLKLISVILLIGGSLLLYSGIAAWHKGILEARFYVFAWTIIIIGAIALMLSHMALLPGDNRPFLVFQIGSALEGFLLSIGLAMRLNMAMRARAEAEHEALEMTAHLQRQTIEDQKRHAAELESHVEERTLELRQTMEQLASANEELEQLSIVDPLTGVYNRRHLTSQLHREWKRACREQVPLSMIMMDIDYFKLLNDTYGHMAGDRCLVELAKLLQEEVQRTSDILARFGGEEFVIVLPNTAIAGAEHLAERIRSRAEAHRVETENHRLAFTLSLGVASQIPGPGSDAEELVRRSDNALYEAKEAGRNRVVVAHELPS